MSLFDFTKKQFIYSFRVADARTVFQTLSGTRETYSVGDAEGDRPGKVCPECGASLA